MLKLKKDRLKMQSRNANSRNLWRMW